MLITRNSYLVFFLFFHSLSFAQTTLESRNISLQLYETSLIEAVKAIEAQSGVSFAYNTSIMKNAQKVSIDVKDADINALLQKICKESGNNYKVINNQVVFFKVTASIAKPIRVLTATETSQQSSSQHIAISKNITQPVKNICDQNPLLGPADKPILDVEKNVITDTLKAVPLTTDSVLNKVNVFPISAKLVPNQDCFSDSLRLSYLNITEQNNSTDKHSVNKYFYSIQIKEELGISPGFSKGDTLGTEEAQMLNNSVISYGFSGGIKLGYSIKRFSFKTGLLYTQFIERFSIKKTHQIFSRQTHLEGITWQEQSSEGIIIHTDTIPITQTIVSDSVAVFRQKYKSSYLEIPFDIDYTIPLNAKWSVFGSLGITYAITLKDDFTTPFSMYSSKAFNKLDISVGVSTGVKFFSNRLHYYFMAGGRARTSLNTNNKLISRNPIYLNMAVGVINYF
ncbi:outer membrane beta-barrel protein [Labilibaculum sp. K2S]|uniref:outer membrane beta-barrel protein n=1 Tax=Labilibaculum sp. K2S TaxID=3056386 RepID=UPI0025A3D9C7|nr:outer membrane beta-barrel protein [Labilibaculum sp. K2S]MDM8160211.1 outer membrane beta-barrel protein [Labilibaculum sp. K2S]